MKFETHIGSTPGKCSCVICGEEFKRDNVAVTMVDEQKGELGKICPKCLEAGAKGAAERARRHATALQEQAKEILNSAGVLDDVPNFPIKVELREVKKDAPPYLPRHVYYDVYGDSICDETCEQDNHRQP
jgi:hypothetical protein